jgi:PAS domain S-box-containing protein
VFLTGQSVKGFDWEILKKNNGKIDVESSVALLRDHTGMPAGFRGVVRDISQRVQARKDLQQSEEKYHTILDIMDEGYIEQNLKGGITFVNDAACRLMGYTREQLIGMHYSNYLAPKVAQKMKDVYGGVYRTGIPDRLVDYDLVRPNGTVITYEINVALKRDASEKPCGFLALIRDVSLRKKAEEEKRLSEEKYRTILEIMQEGYFETDLNGILRFVNDAGCKLVGYPREEIIGRNYSHYSSPETAKRVVEIYSNIQKNDTPVFMFDYEVVHKDGSIRVHQQNVALMHDESGRPKGFHTLVRDVTKLKKAEADLRKSEDKYRNILENMEETYLEMDIRGNFIFFNDSLCRVLGYSRDELQGISYKRLSPKESSQVKAFKEIYRTGKTQYFNEHKMIRKDGSIIYLDMTLSLLCSSDGTPTGFSGFGRNVTERVNASRIIEESEKHLRLITDNIRDVIWTLDFNWNYTYLSPSVFHLTGFTAEEVLSMPLKAILPPHIFKEIETRLATELAREARGETPSGSSVRTLELQMMHKTGKLIWVEVSANFTRDENGKPLEIVGVTRDISERRKAEEALRESETLYRKALETTSDGVSIVQNGKHVYINPQFLKTLDLPKDKTVSNELGAFIHPDDSKVIKYYYEKRLRGEPTPGKHEIRVIKPDQTMMYLHVTTVDIVYHGKPALLNFMQDITTRKLAEKALQESEKRYRTMTENVNDIVWILDLNLQITYASPSNVVLSGYRPEEVTSTPLRDLIPPDSLALAARALGEELAIEASGIPFDPNRSRNLQLEVYSKFGKNVWLEITTTFNRDDDGKAKEILVVGRNITERRQMENALAESEARYRMIVENMHDSISIMDLNFQYAYQSPSEIMVTGFTPEELMRIPIKDQLTPASYNLAEKTLVRELELEFSGKPVDPHRSVTMELEVYHKNGGTIWEEVNTTFQRDENGKPIGLIASSRDITARKKAETALAESERRYRLMAENVNDIIWTLNMDMAFTYVSESVTQVTGYTQEEAKRAPLNQLLTPESYIRASQRLADELALEKSGQPFDRNRAITLEVEAIHKDGSILWLEITGTFNRNDKGEITEILILGRNFTQRKKAEQALAESEKLYRMIVQNMQDVIWIMDLNLQYKYRSPSSMRITGYTVDEMMAIPIKDAFTPESYALAEKILLEELANEQSGVALDPHRARTIELEVYRKDGGTAWIEVTATFNRNEKGEPVEILLAARDIMARKKMEEALRESEKRYRMIVENIHDSISLFDLNFEYIYVSPSEIRITGFTPEEIMKLPVKDRMTPASYAMLETALAEELELETSGKPIDLNRTRTLELEVIHKNGGTVQMELTATFNRNESGQPVGVMITSRNITEKRKAQEELKKSEQRYRMIIENIHEVIWMMDMNFRYTYISSFCKFLTGHSPEEIMNSRIDQLVTPDSAALAFKVFSEQMELELSGAAIDPHRSITLEQETYHKNGGTVLLELTGTFIRDENGKAVGLIIAGRDVTEKKKAAEEKDKLEAQLMQAQKMEVVGRLAGGVAHDFNNMLGVILGYVDLAKLRLAKQHPVLKDIEEIEKAAIRSRDITTQLLAFSRKQIIEPKIIDLNDLIVHTQKALIRLIGEDIELKFHPTENLWAIKFDPSQIEQILINLAVNARDAMPDGGKLTIETANLVLDALYCRNHIGITPGHYVRLSFSDNGMGMDKETVQYIFEPFFTTKEVGKGTGLGLATVYGIVKQNNGFINVYSEPGRGTTFSLYLPYTTEAGNVQDASEEEPEIAGQGNILLVEDDAMVLQITKGMLESIGYGVTAISSPLEALALFKKAGKAFDLVITDVVMPGLSGKDLRERLVAIRPDIRVLFMSGYTADVIARHGVLEEGVQFLQKPFTIKSLSGKVRDVMARTH